MYNKTFKNYGDNKCYWCYIHNFNKYFFKNYVVVLYLKRINARVFKLM